MKFLQKQKPRENWSELPKRENDNFSSHAPYSGHDLHFSQLSVFRGRIPLYNRLNPGKPIAAGCRVSSFASPRPELVRGALFV
ncbi:hypothetical protein KFK09_027618 [Dendrobium nobile]|uniref:Uncharacterized protein n=1 Tax=Dendrobium nobile TaxID=94219 RepID=A0A8T3ABG1_DENNO|nr:hypothetical protein KFK09_027618 [Dendrobium nobile]